MFQQRHFEVIARVISSLLLEGSEPFAERQYIATVFADELARHNPKFNRARFLSACGLPEWQQ